MHARLPPPPGIGAYNFIGAEVRRPDSLLWVFGIQRRARHLARGPPAHTLLIQMSARVFEALHAVSFVTAPGGPAADGLSGFLTRGALACASGLLHNHLARPSDHSGRLALSF